MSRTGWNQSYKVTILPLGLLQPLHPVLEFTVSLLEVVLGLLQPLHPVLDLQVGLRLLEMVPNDFPWPKTWV